MELYEQMLVTCPDRVNPGVLWNSARAVKVQGGFRSRSTAVPGALLDETQARDSVAMPGE
jgi:hypothetical protein